MREKLRPLLLLADQVVFSLGNFLTTLLATRLLSPGEFGSFSILMTANLIIIGLANTLVSEPIRVFGVDKENQTDVQFLPAQLLLRAISAIPVLLISVAAGLLSDEDPAVAVAYSAFCVALLFHELARAINTSSRDWTNVLIGDVCCYASRLLGLVLLMANGGHSSSGIFWMMALGSCVAVIFMPMRLASTRLPSAEYLRTVWKRNWDYGRWLMWEGLVFSASTQVYVFLVGALLSVKDAGGLVAAQTLVNLLNPLLTAATTAVTVNGRLALKDHGYTEWRAVFVTQGALLLATGAAACAFLIAFGEGVMRLVFPPTLHAYASLLSPLAIAMLLTMCSSLLNAAFRTAEMPFVGFRAKLYSALLTALAAYPLITHYGVVGAAYGYVLTQVVWLAVYINQLIFRSRLSAQAVGAALRLK